MDVPQLQRLGELDVLVQPASGAGLAGSGAGLVGSGEGLVVVMCHGFGADAHDLAPLAQVVQAPRGTTWLFPHAPIQVPLGPHVLGRAWFPIDMVALERAIQAGTHRDLSGERPPQLQRAGELIAGMLAALGVPWRRVVLAGFSQGAMVATALAVQAPEPPAGLAILSGTVIDEATLRAHAPARRGMPVFQSHGTHDPLLSSDAAERLHDLLAEAGLVGDLLLFRGEHEIPMAVLERLGAWLRGLRREVD